MVSKLAALAILLAALISTPAMPGLLRGSGHIPTIVVTQTTEIRLLDDLTKPNISGDTYEFTGWATDNSCGQTRCIFGMVNDPDTNPITGSGISPPGIWWLQLTALNAVTPAASTTAIVVPGGVNSLSSYGAAGSGTDCGGNTAWKGYAPFFLNGKGFMNVFRLANSAPFNSCAGTLIETPNNGTDWCNPATFVSGGNDCTIANWSATGDAPGTLNSSTMLWLGSGVNDASHSMIFLTPIQGCHDGTTCNAVPGCDTATINGGYMCFYSQNGDYSNVYLSRILKTDSPMVAANWRYWTGGDPTNPANWSGTLGSAAPVIPTGTLQLPSALWIKDVSSVLLIGTDNTNIVSLTGPTPIGPWTKSVFPLPIKCTDGTTPTIGFPTLIASTLTTVSASPPHDTVMISNNGPYNKFSGTQSDNCYSPYFTQLDVVLR